MAMLDMINGIDTWFNEDGPLDIEQVAESYADLLPKQLLGAGAIER